MSKGESRLSRRIEVEVTPEIVESATVRNSGHCVIADALRLALPQATHVSVDLQTIRFSLPETRRRYIYLTPAAAQHVLVDFDQGKKPKPQRIRLGRPIQTVPMGSPKVKADSPQPTGKKRPDGDPLKKRVETTRAHGRDEPTVVNGRPPDKGALADPPKPLTKGQRRYAGQRRQFGLKLLRE